MKNQELSAIFYEMADLLEIKGIAWKPQAYRKAARTLEGLKQNITSIYNKEGLKGLEKLSGIGLSIANKIIQYLTKGKIAQFETLKKTMPKGIEKILAIPGMGPKKALFLFEKLKIKDEKGLIKAVKQGKIRNLPGFGEKSEQDILRGVQLKEQSKGRIPFKQILPTANKIKNELTKLSFVKKIEIAGSIRRKKATIRDIDLIVLSNEPEKVMSAFVKLPEVKTILGKGKTKGSIVLKNGINADLRIFDKRTFGAGLLYFTGNKDHNIKLRQIAIKKGLKLSEYGLFKNGKRIAGETEEEIYKKLGLKYMKPEERIN